MCNMENTAKKIVEFKNYIPQEQNDDVDVLNEFDEMYRKMREHILISNTNPSNSQLQSRIIELEKELEELKGENIMMKKRLDKSIPIHIIAYTIISAVVCAISIFLLVFRFGFDIYVMDPYYIISALLISLTLFFTALFAIKDWKEFLNGK